METEKGRRVRDTSVIATWFPLWMDWGLLPLGNLGDAVWHSPRNQRAMGGKSQDSYAPATHLSSIMGSLHQKTTSGKQKQETNGLLREGIGDQGYPLLVGILFPPESLVGGPSGSRTKGEKRGSCHAFLGKATCWVKHHATQALCSGACSLKPGLGVRRRRAAVMLHGA